VFGTPEGRAWGILLTAFAIFCILLVTAPLGTRWHIRNATVAQETTLEEPIDGAVYVKDPRGTDLIAVTSRHKEIPEGATIATDEHLRAFIRLFDGSTLTLYNNTQIVLERIRSPRYAASPNPNEIRVRIERGRVAIGVASPLERALQMEVITPHSDISLQEGSLPSAPSGLVKRWSPPGKKPAALQAVDPASHTGRRSRARCPPNKT
jgi:hypothetical protein